MPTAGQWCGGEGLLGMWQGKRASQGYKGPHRKAASSAGNGFGHRRNKKVLGCVCTMKSETTALADARTAQRQTATGSFAVNPQFVIFQ